MDKNVTDPNLSSLFVDDFAACIRGQSLQSIERQMQLIINKISNWATENGFTFSLDKTVCIRFIPSCHAKWKPLQPVELKINNIIIKEVREAKFLGLVFDRTLSFIPHIKQLKTKCKKAMNLLKVVSHQDWGADKDTLLKLYRALIRSKLDYGAIVYGSARPSYLKLLDPIQNQALRIATGAFPTSPIPSLYAETGEPPLEIRRTKVSLSYLTKLSGNPENPAYKCVLFPEYRNKFIQNSNIIPPLSIRMDKHLNKLNIAISHVQTMVKLKCPIYGIYQPYILIIVFVIF